MNVCRILHDDSCIGYGIDRRALHPLHHASMNAIEHVAQRLRTQSSQVWRHPTAIPSGNNTSPPVAQLDCNDSADTSPDGRVVPTPMPSAFEKYSKSLTNNPTCAGDVSGCTDTTVIHESDKRVLNPVAADRNGVVPVQFVELTAVSKLTDHSEGYFAESRSARKRGALGSVSSTPSIRASSSSSNDMQLVDAQPSSDQYLCTDLEVVLWREPCIMCAMALLHSRVKTVVYAHRNPQLGALGSQWKLHVEPQHLNHRFRVLRAVRKSPLDASYVESGPGNS
eukprot:GHVT01008516.1.p1 GENE.GHVT01008516.1~~GHVT01008516.1.p1  ORF type:complete len:281 (-),score=7.49 GHVT01008516.1:4194-5036(-)